MVIIARNHEKEQLEKLLSARGSQFLAIYGRRRVGKTYLIKNYFEQRGLFFHITGVPKERIDQQLYNFSEVYGDTFGDETPDVPKTWAEAFNILRKAISKSSAKRVILFLDELPWLATHKSNFIESLGHCWNRYLDSDPRILLIVCGSAASWMINNVIDAKGGLYDRLTKQMILLPLNLHETEVYLKAKDVDLDRKQILDIFMALGGVPKYLNMVERGKSSTQIIQEVCFSRDNSSLYGEFTRLFRSLFKNSTNHIKIVKILAQVKSGLERDEIVKRAKLSDGGVPNKVIKELIESGFVSETSSFGKVKKGINYRLIDEYSIFYLKWKKEISNYRITTDENYWPNLQKSKAWESWAGFVFEGICQNHINQITKALGISGIRLSYSCWRYKAKNDKEQGVQIDLIIERSDNCINLCEIKHSNDIVTLTKEYAEKLEYKKKKFKEVTKTKKTVFITMITIHGVSHNKHYNRVVHNQLTLDTLFDL